MARIKSSGTNPKYAEMRSTLWSNGDKNFCSVVALAAMCKVTTEEASNALKLFGRVEGKGVCTNTIIRAAEHLGYKMVQVTWKEKQELIASYPGAHSNLKSITTHHPVRFAKAWAGRPDYFMFSRGHVSAYVGGEVVDWAQGCAKRVYDLYTVEKI